METIQISIKDMYKLGVDWSEFCEMTGMSLYAINEGLSEDTIVDCPVELIKRYII